MKYLSAAFLVLLSNSVPVLAGEVASVKGGAPTVTSAVEKGSGPATLARMLAQYEADPTSISTSSIDAVAGQYGAVWSRLFWHTNLEDAKITARSEGKPILYLRMMGKLTDEYSCANSRFFRTVLYTNAAVSKLLREKFVLVWESERPVPVITVDYGDGRVLKRTITGNSIHYVLNANGRIVDALPGLYDPVAFARIVSEAGEVARSGTENQIRFYMSDAGAALNAAFAADMKTARFENNEISKFIPGTTTAANAMANTATKRSVEGPLLRAALPPEVNAAPPARTAMGRAFSKGGVESPLVAATVPARPLARDAMGSSATKSMVEHPLLNAAADADIADADGASIWGRLAAIHKDDARLDANSIALIRSQNAGLDESKLAATIAGFETSLAIDTARNNYEFRPHVLQWLMQTSQLVTPRDLNERVYGELFLTPRSDPWLGLAPENTYTALTNEGCSLASRP